MRRRRRRRWEKKLEVALEVGRKRSDRSREQTGESENDEMTSSRHHLPEKKRPHSIQISSVVITVISPRKK